MLVEEEAAVTVQLTEALAVEVMERNTPLETQLTTVAVVEELENLALVTVALVIQELLFLDTDTNKVILNELHI
jgi:hypothetical protein